MIKQQVADNLKQAVEELGFEPTDAVISIAVNSTFGDYSSNIALQLAKQNSKKGKQSSIDIANDLLTHLKGKIDAVAKIEVAGPGFLNFFIKDDFLLKSEPKTSTKSQKILVEYAQPNTHKAFHIGHLRNITLGESIARLLESQGHQVYRATYGSDIGLPVAKALWGVQQNQEEYQKIKSADLKARAEFLGRCYAAGAQAYDNDAKDRIDQLNKQLYARDPELLPLWQETRQWSLDYFQTIFKRLGTQFDGVFHESEVEAKGAELVQKYLGTLFEKDNGAVVFKGEKYGLHTRVFQTSVGNPTYEAKELGLAEMEREAFPYDLSLHVVGNEQQGYFAVIIKVLELVDQAMEGKKKHLSYGMVNLPSGKMSSRTGEIISADDILDQVADKVSGEEVVVGAIKFAMLKYSPEMDIAFDLEKSVSLHGDSGPYLQYAYVRTKSILAKTEVAPKATLPERLTEEERLVMRDLFFFEEIVTSAATQYRPNILAEYLVALAKDFNLFYQKHRVLESDSAEFRLWLTEQVGKRLEEGLGLLGISSPAKM